jgi:hypothetical protein
MEIMFINRLLTTIVLISLWLSTASTAQVRAYAVSYQPDLVMPAAPASFAKVAPANNATGVPILTTLTWTASSTPGTIYEYCLVTINKCPNGRFKSAGTNTSVSVSLLPGTIYFWQVRAHSGDKVYTYADNGLLWNFNTLAAPPGAFSKVSPANGLTGQPRDLTLTWEAATGLMVSYQVCYDQTDDNTCDSGWSLPFTGTSYPLTGLDAFTTYYWQVQAANSDGTVEANDGTWWSFQTEVAAPGTFGKLSPANNDENLPLNIFLNWSESSGAGISYDYCLDKELLNNNQCDSGWVAVAPDTLEVMPGTLEIAQTYYWQVRASNDTGTMDANNGVWWRFETLPEVPEDFQKINPQDGAINVGLKPYLYWTLSDGSGVTYEYCLIEYVLNQGCQDGDYVNVGTDTYIAVQTALARNTEHIWQIRARDSINQLTYADNPPVSWHFTTLPELPVVDETKAVFSVLEDQSLSGSLSASATSPSGLDLIFTLFDREPAGQAFLLGANGSFIYTPEPDFNGLVTFQYTVSDGVNPPSSPHTATITVTAVNDRPVFSGDFQEVKTYNFSYPVDSDILLLIETFDADLPYGDTLTISLIAGVVPDGATLLFSGPTSPTTTAEFSWPAATWSVEHPQPYAFTVRVTDSQGLYSDLTFTITIEPIRMFAPLVKR